MTSSLPSGYNGSESVGFDRLDPAVRRWIWDHGWDELRDIQEQAIDALLQDGVDVIVSAATASGKTEAAFLPIVSRMASERVPSIHVLYVAPLKALINDQFGRMQDLCERLDIPVTPWHGDVAPSVKRRLLKQPRGLLLTTPESLEAICINHGSEMPGLFRCLTHVVVDELHSFIGTERGRQLQSLLHRVDCAIGRQPVRVGLSATLGDLSLAASYLRESDPARVRSIVSRDASQELRAQVRGYVDSLPLVKPDNRNVEHIEEPDEEAPADIGSSGITRHLFSTLRLSSNLIFANARTEVEKYASALSSCCEKESLPNNFFPHHGNLSKDIREESERLLKAGSLPINVVCTSTLEMGIDIGAMDSVAQIGSPPSVAGLRQRLGRSGRRGQPAVLRIYVRENEIGPHTSVLDGLRLEVVQSAAMLSLMLEGWCEPPDDRGLHLSTLVQQTLSVVAQYGAAGAPFLWRLLCQSGPFKNISRNEFADLLRGFAKHELISQSSDGTLVLGLVGERLVNHYSFYASFATPESYRVFHNAKPLGTLPLESTVAPDSYIIFAGRRWRVSAIDNDHKTIDLVPAKGGRLPIFGGDMIEVHDRVRVSMTRLYQELDPPNFLDSSARRLLAEGRETYARYELATTSLLESASDTYVFHWRGDRIGRTISLLLTLHGVKSMQAGPAVLIPDTDREETLTILENVIAEPPPDSVELTALVVEKRIEKFDRYVSPALLEKGYAARMLDIAEAYRSIERTVNMG